MVHDDAQLSTIKQWLGSGSLNIFGLPFAGKDTQARHIGKLLDTPVIGSGEILRSSPDQEKIKELMLTGKLFPTDYYLSIILPYLDQKELEGKPLVLSSVGRWHGEEDAVMEAAETADHPIKAVIFLELEEQEVWRRFEISQSEKDRGQRHDDAEHLIETRLAEFRTKTLPVLKYYREKHLLVHVSGEGTPHMVTERIINQLYGFIKGKA